MTTAPWRLRRGRIAALAASYPHAGELLRFYEQLLSVQEPVWRVAADAVWCRAAQTNHGINLERIDVAGATTAFSRFVTALRGIATERLAPVADEICRSPSLARRVLETSMRRDSLDRLGTEIDVDPPLLAFFPRAFLQPVAESIGAVRSWPELAPAPPPADGQPAVCPRCDWPPQLSVLRDEPEVKGRRVLLCALCSSVWVYPRLACPGCGETDADRLNVHVFETWPQTRVEQCVSCRTYLKAVDLRVDGRAVPLVDELASVELDVWADGEGFVKLTRNLLGL